MLGKIGSSKSIALVVLAFSKKPVPNMHIATDISLLLFFAIIVALVLSKPRYLTSRRLMLFRVCFPSWRFFESISSTPVFFVRTRLDSEPFGTWISCRKLIRRSFLHIVYNPDGSLRLAINSLLEQIQEDTLSVKENDIQSFQLHPSYLFAINLAKFELAELNKSTDLDFDFFQFKIALWNPEKPIEQADDVLISTEHKKDS